jgi:flagella basal body P-ring formation protein FlgA
MIRLALVALAALTVASPALAGTAVALRPSLTVSGTSVTLGDLFDGAGAAGKVVVGAVPGPGMNAVLDAGRVQLMARQAGLDWANDLGMRRIVVASGAAAVRTAGRRQVLAYARNLNAGDIVQPADLRWSDEAVAGPNAPNDPDAVIGQAARRPLREGSAVQSADLAQPMVIHRDETISVAFQAGGITLVLQGKALKDAAMGESVQVLNPQSKKTIEAVAAGPGKAVVGPSADRLKAAPFATASLR